MKYQDKDVDIVFVEAATTEEAIAELKRKAGDRNVIIKHFHYLPGKVIFTATVEKETKQLLEG